MNLFSESFADRLTRLWKHNRAEVYYREAVASAEQVETMLSLAGSVHQHVLEFAASRHECVCSR